MVEKPGQDISHLGVQYNGFEEEEDNNTDELK